MKICSLCKVHKPSDQYALRARSADGRYPQCKTCVAAQNKLYYEQKKEAVKARTAAYYQANRQTILANLQKNNEVLNQKARAYKRQNRDKISAYNSQYRGAKKEEIKLQRQSYRKENRSLINEYETNKLRLDSQFKLAKRLRNRLGEVIREKRLEKTKSFKEYLGCTGAQLKTHLEAKFQPGMSWDNYGEWHVDHIISLSSADTAERLYDLSHYKNLRPLWAQDNLAKNNKHGMSWQKLQRDRFLDEDVQAGAPTNIKARDFILAEERFSTEHREFIKRYEWLGTVGFGVRYVFTARHGGLLAGVVLIAEPNGYQFDIAKEALIQRGACAGWTPKNLGSRLIMFACRWMVKHTPKRIFVGYGDTEAGEIGTIYQACGFTYLGSNFGSARYYKTPTGKLVTERQFTRTSAMKKWAKDLKIKWLPEWSKANGFQNIKAIPPDIFIQLKDRARIEMATCTIVKAKPKLKYALFLGVNPKQFNMLPLPYPKRTHK